MTAVLGVDGARGGGWVALIVDDDGSGRVLFAETFRQLLRAAGDVASVGVDIPIGSVRQKVRRADVLTRKLLGPRASSVFPSPRRACQAEAGDYEAAGKVSKELTGRKLSKQSFALLPRIIEVEERWYRDPDLIREVHPELSFAVMAGGPLETRKTTPSGTLERLRLLRAHGIDVVAMSGDAGPAGLDDIIDAGAVAWTASRLAAGTASSLPSPGEPDEDFGLPVAIWF
jgi:predicted RNase H-like nuclease